jgi:hypothetical protein
MRVVHHEAGIFENDLHMIAQDVAFSGLNSISRSPWMA